MEALLFLAWVFGCVWIGERIYEWQPEPPPRLARALRDARIVARDEPRVPTHEAVGIGFVLGWFAFLVMLVLT